MRPVGTRIVLALLLPAAAAFGQLVVHKEVPPPLTLRLEDLCTATIAAPAPLTVWVKGEATEETHGPIGRVTTKPFELQSGTNRYDVANVPPIDEKWFSPEYERLVMMTGLFPEGDYWLKVYVYSTGGQLLGSDSVRHVVRYPQLTLVSPPDGSETGAPDQFFNWAISLPVPGLEYELSVYEILAGQTKYDAVNNIPHFRQGGPFTTSLQYPPGAKPFEPGHSYCWQVRALVQPSYLISTSEIWGFVFGAAAPAESCTYFLDEDGKMRHSLGRWGTREVAPESCHYIYSKQQKMMYHTNGTAWKVDSEAACTWVKADNGMYHSLGGGEWEGPKTYYKCNYLLAKNGMWHSTGTGWEPEKPDSCTYIFSSLMGGRLFHADGTGWKADTAPKCTYILAKNGMFHSEGLTWTPVTGKKCSYIMTKHGMRHFDGLGWVVIEPRECRYIYCQAQDVMFHGNGTTFETVPAKVCYWVKAENGMYHFTGRGWSGPFRGPRFCYCRLALNGLFHWGRGDSWELVKPNFCTYVFDNEHNLMLHGVGDSWVSVADPEPCNYLKAYNGMFHWVGKGKGWVPEPIKECKYLFSNIQKTMWHSTRDTWEIIPGEQGKVISARNGTYRYEEGKGWVEVR